MRYNYTPAYFGPIIERFNNTFNTDTNKINGNYQEDIPYIFSPINKYINILELSSLQNSINNNCNSFYNVKVKKLPNVTKTDIIFTNSGKKILVLDLDETLVHSSKEKPFPNKRNIVLHSKIQNIIYTIYVIVRPFLDIFLHEMSLCYDLYIYTASLSQYAETLIKIIDKNKVIIQILNRYDCKFIKGVFFKDLSIFKKDYKDIIIVDNNPISYALNKHNGIPIITWIDNPNDKELLKLIPILKFLSKVKDVRPYINKITDITKTKIDYTKVNEILKTKKKNEYHFKQGSIAVNNNEVKYPKGNLKLNININYNNKYNANIDNQTINHPLNTDMPKKIKAIKDGMTNNKSKDIFLIKKLKLNDINNKSFKKFEMPKNKYNITSIKNNTGIYNVSFENLSNIQNTINIFNNNIDSNTLEYRMNNNINKMKTHNKIFLTKPKKNIKNIQKEALKNFKNQINKNMVKKVADNKERNLSLITEVSDKYPVDKVRNNLNKYVSLIHRNTFYKKNLGKNNLNYIESSEYSAKDLGLTGTIRPEKNSRMVVMKILSKPKKKRVNSISNDNSKINIKVTKINPKRFERPNLDKFPSAQIRFNNRKIIRFEKI